MKVLVTGVRGQLGYDVIRCLKKRKKSIGDLSYKGIDIQDLDITDKNNVDEYIEEYNPDVVIHCAAFTAVDKAEGDRDICYKVNVIGTKNIAHACRNINATMVYISTDYVFDGQKELPYEVNDDVNPLNYYGLTKLQGEETVRTSLDKYFIIRTSWVFGKNGNNFVKTMLRLANEKETITVVKDQYGSPTYTVDLANLICEMIETDKYGTYHATNEEFCSWYEFACEIFKKTNVNVTVKPVTSEEYVARAKRSQNSRLSKIYLEIQGFKRLPGWENALSRYLGEIESE